MLAGPSSGAVLRPAGLKRHADAVRELQAQGREPPEQHAERGLWLRRGRVRFYMEINWKTGSLWTPGGGFVWAVFLLLG